VQPLFSAYAVDLDRAPEQEEQLGEKLERLARAREVRVGRVDRNMQQPHETGNQDVKVLGAVDSAQVLLEDVRHA